jgi:hypothetical protein
MITTGNVRDLIKTITPTFNKYYVGKLDNKHDKGVCVYAIKNTSGRIIAVGGDEATVSKEACYTILIHWEKNYSTTEEAAQLLYDNLSKLREAQIGPHTLNYIEMLTDVPIDVHTDDSGVYERVIDIKIHYN